MVDNQTVVLFYSGRSDWAPVEKIAKILENKLNLRSFLLHDMDYDPLYTMARLFLEDVKPIAVIIPCDRPEMVFAALAARFLRIPIIHLYAGDFAGGSWDDQNRMAISLYASYLFCTSRDSWLRVTHVRDAARLTSDQIYATPSPTADIGKVDDSYKAIANQPYNLILYNPVTTSPEVTESELRSILIHCQIATIGWVAEENIWIEPTNDVGAKELWEEIRKLRNIKFIPTQPRSTFLSLLKHANKFISNSSATVYEAPLFLEYNQIIHIGKRNMYRKSPDLKRGGSEEIAKRIVKIVEDLNRAKVQA